MSEHNEKDSPRNSHKRPRPVISCLACRRKKLKCDRRLPCNQCTKGRQSACCYQDGQEPEPRADDPEPPSKHSRVNSSSRDVLVVQPKASISVASSEPLQKMGVIEQLQRRLDHVEGLLGVSQSAATSTQQLDERRSSQCQIALTNPIRSRREHCDNLFPIASSYVRKFRSQDHESADPRLATVMHNLRELHDSIKHHHRGNQPLDDRTDDIQHLIPPEAACLALTQIYFDNTEHCFRTLHRPTFEAQLGAYFEGSDRRVDSWFLPQLVCVLSIAILLGTSEVAAFLAADGRLVQISVEYAMKHLASVGTKARKSIEFFQTSFLVLLLRWMRVDRLQEIWDASGSVLRQALLEGMDRDPSELQRQFSPFQAEMRRRLWLSIVETELMLSVLVNMPCMIPEFTCRPPLNVNDGQIYESMPVLPVSRSYDEWTDCLCQCFLADSIRQRLHGLHILQSSSEARYELILEHTRALEKVLQHLPPPLRFYHQADAESSASARLMARMELDISIRRPLMHLYSPFATANDSSDGFAEARAGFLQSCFMIGTYQDLFDPKYSEINVDIPGGYWDFFYNVYRHELTQSVVGQCLEIKRLKTSAMPNTPVANEGFPSFRMPNYTKASLIHSIADTLEPMTRRITRFGADLKDLTYLTLIFQSVLSTQEDSSPVIEGLEDLVDVCKSQLEKDGVPVLRQTQNGEATPSQQAQFASDLDNEWLGSSNTFFDFGYTEDMTVNFTDIGQSASG